MNKKLVKMDIKFFGYDLQEISLEKFPKNIAIGKTFYDEAHNFWVIKDLFIDLCDNEISVMILR